MKKYFKIQLIVITRFRVVVSRHEKSNEVR
jgi:hypothetical protein